MNMYGKSRPSKYPFMHSTYDEYVKNTYNTIRKE